MINEGGKWAHVVLRKCVFEPKAVGISGLMHQPSTGHLRATVCCAVSLVPAERRCIDSPTTPFLFCCSFYTLCPSLPFFHTSFVSFTYPFPASRFRSFICLPPLSLPPLSTTQQSHWVCTHCTIASMFSVSVFCLCVI